MSSDLGAWERWTRNCWRRYSLWRRDDSEGERVCWGEVVEEEVMEVRRRRRRREVVTGADMPPVWSSPPQALLYTTTSP